MRITYLAGVFFGVALVWAPPHVSVAHAAQAPNPCERLTGDEVQALVPKEHVGAGAASANADLESYTCGDTWGVGTGRMTLSRSSSIARRGCVPA